MSKDLTRLSAAEMSAALAAGEVTSRELTQAHLDKIAQIDGEIHAFLYNNAQEALAAADAADARRASGDIGTPLTGVPIAVKDVLATKGMPSTSGSKILEGWIPPYDATTVAKLRAAGMPILGKTNMDEFAMGSSTEFSAYGPTHNPWDPERIPGGSGGGSAAAVSAFEAPVALGSDTGGSIRQPAAMTGSVGVKPTYGAVSRYGAIALASSLDQIGPVARNVMDTAMLHDVIAGHDPLDSTSLDVQWASMAQAAANRDLKGVKVGVVRELSGEGFQQGVSDAFAAGLEHLKQLGAEIVDVSAPHFEYAISAYYIILPAEASSNLARFDGVRFGLRVMPSEGEANVENMMKATREAGFGPEVKRRVILGTYALSAGYYDAYYGNAQKVRTLIQQDFNEIFEQVDVIATPTAPTTAFKFGDKLDDPLSMYLNDVATIPANLAGIPGISLPVGRAAEDGLPVGIQFLSPAYEDARLYSVAGALEASLEHEWGHPFIDFAPRLGADEEGAK